MKIVPALLTDNQDEFKRMLAFCGEFTDFVQVDIMDGIFVPSRSITVREVRALSPPLRSEAHLMAENPLDWIEAFSHFGAERIIYHFEVCAEHKKIISRIRSKGLGVGIAINPPTQIGDFEDLVEEVDMVLFMSVHPGFYGSAFIPEVLNKISEFKKLFPNKTVGIDGGVKLENVHLIARAGIEHICVGSALLKAPDPRKAYEKFIKIIQ